MTKDEGKKARKSPIAIILIVVIAIILIAFVWNYNTIKAYSNVGTAYAARVVCSCRYVGGRPLDDCKKDLEPGMELVSLSEHGTDKHITATMVFLAENQAEFRGASGCVLLSQTEREAREE